MLSELPFDFSTELLTAIFVAWSLISLQKIPLVTHACFETTTQLGPENHKI